MIIRTIEFSSTLFGGFKFKMNVETIKSVDDLIDYAKNELVTVLKRYNFIMLIDELQKCNFHIHTHTLEDIFQNEYVIYICDHC